MSIPKPVPKKKLEEDRRMEHLKQWKELFQSIDASITVTICNDEVFSERLTEVLGDIEFDFNPSDAKIVIELPRELELHYLIGLVEDEMFSHEDVLADPLLGDNQYYPCEPKTKKWKEYYAELCDIVERVRKNIPPPLA